MLRRGYLQLPEGITAIAPYAVSGALLAIAFPRANQSAIAWSVLAPFFYCIYRLPWNQVVIMSFAFGAGFVAALVWWVGLFGALLLILLATLVSLIFFVGFAALARALGSELGPWGRLLLLPSLWVFVEWLSSLWITGFPWWSIGTSQYRALPLLQISSVTGVWGVSFLLALSNAVIANAVVSSNRRIRRRVVVQQVALVAAVTAGLWAWGARAMDVYHPGGRSLRAGVIQGNIPQNVPHDRDYVEQVWRTYGDLTAQAADQGAEFILWPEGTIPGRVTRNPVLLGKLETIAGNSGDVRLLAGGRDEGEMGEVYNCAFLVGANRGLLGRYAKVHLVPFAEFVVLRNYLPNLTRYRVLPYDVSPGQEVNTLSDGADSFGAVICFESIFPQISRQLASRGAQLLCVLTNDAYYDRTAAAEQHLSKAVCRAVENRRFLLRGASTGISCIVDPCGRIIARAPLREEKVLTGSVTLIAEKSFYTQHGDWFVYVCMAAAAMLGAISLRGARASRPRPASRR